MVIYNLFNKSLYLKINYYYKFICKIYKSKNYNLKNYNKNFNSKNLK